MAWKEAAAQLGTGTLVSGLKALEGTMKKRDFKRLVSNTVAQLLEVHPDLGRKKARRWARRATGTKPGKVPLRKKGGPGLKEAVGVAAVTAGVAKVAGKLGERGSEAVRGRRGSTARVVKPEASAESSA